MSDIEIKIILTAGLQHTKVIALFMHSDEEFITAMLKAGALSYLLKDCAVEELICAVQTVINNKI